MLDTIKKYRIPIILFGVAIAVYLSVAYALQDGDDYLYFVGAINILQNHSYSIDGQSLWHPMGYPLLIVPFLIIFGISVQSGVYPCAILGALTVVLLYEFTKYLLDKRAAIFAAFFLIFSFQWEMSNVIMSEVPALFFMVLSIFAVAKYVKTQKSSFAYLFYAALAVACLIRYASALVLVVVFLYLLLSRNLHLLKRKEVWLGIPLFFIILLPQLIYNYVSFGGPFKFGYPMYGKFGLDDVSRFGGSQFQSQAIQYIKHSLFAFGKPVLPFLLFGTGYVLWKWKKSQKHEVFSLILPWILLPLITFSLYITDKLRYIILVLPALLFLSGYGFSKMWEMSRKGNKTFNRILIFLLVTSFLVPTAMFRFDRIRRREMRAESDKKAFVWLRENSENEDIILCFGSGANEYYSQRRLLSIYDSHDNLGKIISKYNISNNIYLITRKTYTNRNFNPIKYDIEQWLEETYGLTLLKTFEVDLPLSLPSKILLRLIGLTGIYSSDSKDYWFTPTTDRSYIYLINK